MSRQAHGNELGLDDYDIFNNHSSYSGGNAGFLGSSQGLGHTLNVSALSQQTSSVTSSKAVLNALKALQDKIRRLENERSQALDECSELKHQLKALEIETDHAKQKENLAIQRTIQESRVIYDKLQNEKVELELKLSRLEEKNRQEQQHATELQDKIRSLEDDKIQQLHKIKDLEGQIFQLESQVSDAQKFERDSAQSLLRESKRHENEVAALTSRIKSLQQEIDQAYEDKSSGNGKVKELDKLVGQLLAVNESLVEQLSGKVSARRRHSDAPVYAQLPQSQPKKPPAPVASASPKASVKPTSKSFNLVPRVANVSTAATAASKTKKATVERLVPVKSDQIENLQRLHNMYAEMANSILEKRSPSLGRSRSPSVINASTYTRNESRDISYLEKETKKSRSRTPTRTSKKKPATSHGRTPLTGQNVFGVDLREESQPISIRIPQHRNIEDSVLTFDSQRSDSSNGNSFNQSRGKFNAQSLDNSFRPENNRPATDLNSVVSTLEEEFDVLNAQYRKLLGAVQSDDSINESQRAEELISVIQKLHKKGEQLRALKSPAKI